MNKRIRQLQTDLINLLNSYNDVPIETKWLALAYISGIVEKEADKTIALEVSMESQPTIVEYGELDHAEST